MAEIVNLNRFRKDRARAAEAAQAEENRAAHGRSKAEKQAEAARKDKADKALDQHRRDDEPA